MKNIETMMRDELETHFTKLYAEAVRLQDLVIKYEDIEMAKGYDFLGLKADITSFIENHEYDEALICIESLQDQDDSIDAYYKSNPFVSERKVIKFVRDELRHDWLMMNGHEYKHIEKRNGRLCVVSEDGTVVEVADGIPTKFEAKLVLDDYLKQVRNWKPANS